MLTSSFYLQSVSKPKTIFNILDYKIEEGSTANFSLFKIDNEFTFSKSDIFSKSKNSAFIGKKMKGVPIGIIVNDMFLINE